MNKVSHFNCFLPGEEAEGKDIFDADQDEDLLF